MWYPLQFKPVYKRYLWGGDRINRCFQRGEPPGRRAESWEVCDRPEGMSVVLNGPLAGTSLGELVARHGPELMGTAWEGGFPLLVKLIDARETLSVQVHPDEEAARRIGGEPKTEMWVVLSADPGAEVVAGFIPGTGAGDVRRALAAGRLPDLLRRVPVTAGDAVFIPGGRVHAIGAGCLLLEVQQNSDTTYRLYDWDRKVADGPPRPLHIEEALQAIHWDDRGAGPLVQPRPAPAAAGNSVRALLHDPLFAVDRYTLQAAEEPLPAAPGCRVLFCAAGNGVLQWQDGQHPLRPGTTLLLPAALGPASLVPETPGFDVLAVDGCGR